jgi:RimJ/RimL family protein N-acetyltransferase
VLNTGCGEVRADHWPEPRVLIATSATNHVLLGEPAALQIDASVRLHGFVDANPAFEPLLRALDPRLVVWDRVIYRFHAPHRVRVPRRAMVRRLVPADEAALAGLSPDLQWIYSTWGDAARMILSGAAWGAWLDGRLASVAGTFFRGTAYEDVGVVTEPPYRGLGLSAACAAGLCADILRSGRQPSWNTSRDNLASRRVAEKVGFRRLRDDQLYVVGRAPPD